MERIDRTIRVLTSEAIRKNWNRSIEPEQVQVQKTRRDFEGDLTIVVFPFQRFTGLSPDETARVIGEYLTGHSGLLSEFNVIRGFLNLSVDRGHWYELLGRELQDPDYGILQPDGHSRRIMIEFSSPNTNKPLHLGHIRNNLIGHSISRILEASGEKVRKVNLVNDRGIHICKSMLAWEREGSQETPASSGLKGDHLVGKYYVRFEKIYREEVNQLVENGMDRKEAELKAPVMEDAREMLRKWEAGDPGVRALWEQMNAWVYEGFEQTYRRMGVDFHQIYYESETYTLGKEIILQGLAQGVLYRKEDGSVWADLSGEGLDHKLLLRADGTSVYMTQDVGTAHQRYEEYGFDSHIYVVGNEQNYHFQVLSLVLKKLGYQWADRLFHLSYGMVELPGGRMKSREGTVVDADDLMDEMEATATKMSEELGKLGEYEEDERKRICRQVGMGALKYFILKVDPKKNMTFDPAESVDFNGNTGPFIQYTYARIRSVLRRAPARMEEAADAGLNDKEVDLVKLLYEFPDVVKESAGALNPSFIANYLYELAREFNQFYHDYSILGAESAALVAMRLWIVRAVGRTIESGTDLLGIEVPERM